MPPQYEDFFIKVTGSPGNYQVEAHGPGEILSLSQPFIYEKSTAISATLNRIEEGGVPSFEEMRAVGSRLFEALFPRTIFRAFERASSVLPKGTSLRLKLLIRPPELALLPWELLYDSDQQRFLAAHLSSPLVRVIESGVPAAPLEAPHPLRLLYVPANPLESPHLDLTLSQEAIRESLATGMDLLVLEEATPTSLQKALREEPGFHILHYDGHATFDEFNDTGLIYLHDSEGKSFPLDSQLLATYLAGTSVRLIILSACKTAVDSKTQRFVGLAQRLLHDSNLPAVVAMQFAIPDTSAVAFNRGFYQALNDGYPVDAAVIEGRKAILEQLSGFAESAFAQPDWAAPVLFMRARDGFLSPSRKRSAPAVNTSERRDLLTLLDKVQRYWIDTALNQSLQQIVLLALGKKRATKLVEHPWERVLEFSGLDKQPIPPEEPVEAIFDKLGQRMLILGAPGAGKTITLLTLARALIRRAEEDPLHPIPIVLRLSTWTPSKPFRTNSFQRWLEEELANKYHIVQRHLARRWLQEHRLLLLLDGLDEVRSEHQVACITAINEFMDTVGAPGLAVCSRSHEYQDLPMRLKLEGAIHLQPLTLTQVQTYLERGGIALSGLRAALQEDTILQELAQTPLMLSVMTLAYQNQPAETLTDKRVMTTLRSVSWKNWDLKEALARRAILEQRRDRIFAAYIDRMLTPDGPPQPYRREQTIYWLSWLARRMQQHNQTVFLVEQLQPSWLQPPYQAWLYIVLVLAIIGIPIGIGVGQRAGLGAGLSFGLLMSLFSAMTQVEPIEGLAWSWRRSFKFFSIGLFCGLILWFLAMNVVGLIGEMVPALLVGSVGGALIGLTGKRDANNLTKLIVGLIYTVALTIIAWVYFLMNTEAIRVTSTYPGGSVMQILAIGVLGGMFGIHKKNIEANFYPNQRIWRSAKYAMVFGLCAFLILMVPILVDAWKNNLNVLPLMKKFWVDLITVFLIISMLVGGGLAVVKHFLLRAILSSNDYLPWKLVPFLDYASSLTFLHKVGGGYIFIHNLILDYLARLDVKRE